MDTSSLAPLTTTTTTTTTAGATPTAAATTASASVSITPTTTSSSAAASTGQPAVASSDEPAGAVSTTTTAPQTATTTSASYTTTTTSSLSASSPASTAAASITTTSAAATSVATVTATAAMTPAVVSANGLLSTTTATPPTNTAAAAGTTPTSTHNAATAPTQPTVTGCNAVVGGTGLPPQSKTGTTDKGGLPKAMIKPNVLTHVIEGFVIQEANEPFPNHWQRGPEWDSSDEPPKKRSITDSGSPISPSNGPSPQQQQQQQTQPSLALPAGAAEMGNCEICGKPEPRSKMKRKRFCSVDCARAAKQNSTDQVTSPSHNGTAEAHPTSTGNGLDHSSVTTTVNPVAPSNIKLERMDSTDQSSSHLHHHHHPHHPPQFAAATPMETGAATIPVVPAVLPEESPIIMKWSVQEVCDFIKNLPGCSDYAEDFAIHEIDGQALLLLKENHLVNTMGMKLGPALKIVAKIHSMIATVTADGQQQQQS